MKAEVKLIVQNSIKSYIEKSVSKELVFKENEKKVNENGKTTENKKGENFRYDTSL